MEISVKQRLVEFIKYVGVSQSAFERMCGMSNGYVNNLKNTMGVTKLQSVLSAFPALNGEWLLYGKGEMLNSNTDTSVVQSETNALDCEDAEVIESFPMLPEEVTVNPNTDIEEFIEENSSELERVNPTSKLSSANAAERILRTSMMPTFQPEDIVFVRFLPDRMKICDGDIYYLNCKNRPTMIRRIKFEADDKLRLIAQNPQYGDVLISREDIINVGTIVGLLRMTFGDQYAEIEAVRREKDEQIGNMLNMQRELISEIREQGKRQDKLIDKIIG